MSEKRPGKTTTSLGRFLEAAEFDAGTPGMRGSVGRAQTCTRVLEPIEFDASDDVPSGPATRLRLTFQIPAGVAVEEAARDLAELLHALDAFDRARGGAGLVLARGESRATEGSLTVVLCPLDLRGSRDRFGEMAELLGCSREVVAEKAKPDGDEATIPAPLLPFASPKTSPRADAPPDVRRWAGRVAAQVLKTTRKAS